MHPVEKLGQKMLGFRILFVHFLDQNFRQPCRRHPGRATGDLDGLALEGEL
jgi:hypothetical protein